MKRIITSLTIAVVLLSSCVDNVYINGDLDGMWQLQKVEDTSSGSTIYPLDIYYSFQRNLTFISRMNENEEPLRYLGNFYYDSEKGTINIDGLRLFPQEKPAATKEDLKQFMLYDLSTTFIIDHLSSKQLIMSDGTLQYTLKKW